MSDSNLPDPVEEAEIEDDQVAEEQGLGMIESGIAGLFASFEQGVMNLLDDKPKDPDAAHGAKQRAPVEPREVPPGRTYDEVLTPMKWKPVFVGFAIIFGLFLAYFALNYVLVRNAATNDETRSADVIVVLGAAQFDGTPSPVFANRLDHAHDLWSNKLADVIVTTGANQEGDRFTEGFTGYLYLRDLGVPDESIITVVDGTDTWEQLSATSIQMTERGFDSALLVSDGYHNYRLGEIADEVGMRAWVSPTDLGPTHSSYAREATAVSIGRVIGYRRLSAFQDDVSN